MTVTGAPGRGNLLVDFYDQLPGVIAQCVPDPRPVTEPGAFHPGYALPELDDELVRFFAVAGVRWQPVGEYHGHPVTLLDLTANPGTHTTKTYASLLIVARAVRHIRDTGRSVLIVSPTSANKGVALRDAVLRALDAGLVTPEQLRVVIVAPGSGRAKLRASRLSRDPWLRRLNPMLLCTAAEPEAVKALAREFVADYAGKLHASEHSVDTWFSLDLTNYLIADSARALFEQRVAPVGPGEKRLHAHAVSSAYGLLGYHAGRELLERRGVVSPDSRAASLLVQHLATPDMVLALRQGAPSQWRLPEYHSDPATGLLRRSGDDQHFPAVTYALDEVLDPTFYTHRPVTATAMNEIIAQHGGDGIVVSLAECVARYPYLRHWLADALPTLPADLRTLREWSTVMALTGVTNAVDRRLLPAGQPIVVHGTGCYSDADFELLGPEAITEVSTVDDIATAVG
jgi:hypothetical protein